MVIAIFTFVVALVVLLISARFFTASAEQTGQYFQMPPFVIGVFIVGIGTSLPELISSVLSVQKSVSEIVPGNIIGANVSNILLLTGMVAFLNRKTVELSKPYLFIDLHFMLGSMVLFGTIGYDGVIEWKEAFMGILAFLVYCFYLIKEGNGENISQETDVPAAPFPYKALFQGLIAGTGIYFGADYTVQSIEAIARMMDIPPSVIALTVLSLGTTLPELAVNISAVRQGKAEMAIGNVLGSSVFNATAVPAVASLFGNINVPQNLLSFPLPFMAAATLFFYLLTQDKKISPWEGVLFILIFILFLVKASSF